MSSISDDKNEKNYSDLKRRLTPFHRFTFSAVKNFTPQQKAAISRAWDRLGERVINYELARVDRSALPRPQTVHGGDWYGDKFDKLKKLHGFSFRKRKNFTGPQKAAITKQWKKLETVVKDLEQGEVVFKPIKKKTQRRRLSSRFKATNKGIFLYDKKAKKITARDEIVTDPLTGKKKRTTVLNYQTGKFGVDKYIPRPADMLFPDFVRWVFETYQPYKITLATGNSQGNKPYLPEEFNLYLPDFLETEKRIDEDRTNYRSEDVFHGVYLHWFESELERQLRGTVAKKRRKKVKRKKTKRIKR